MAVASPKSGVCGPHHPPPSLKDQASPHWGCHQCFYCDLQPWPYRSVLAGAGSEREKGRVASPSPNQPPPRTSTRGARQYVGIVPVANPRASRKERMSGIGLFFSLLLPRQAGTRLEQPVVHFSLCILSWLGQVCMDRVAFASFCSLPLQTLRAVLESGQELLGPPVVQV